MGPLNDMIENAKKQLIELEKGGNDLVYKKIEILQFCADPDCVGLEIIEVGGKLKQKIIDFGKE